MASAKSAKSAAESAAERTFEARNAAWSSWGEVDSDVISHAINPSFMGGPRWPRMRQAYRVARKNDVVLLASDGLSDPYDEDEGPDDVNGVEVEFFAATDDKIARAGASGVMAIAGTWLHDLVFQISHIAAQRGDLASLIDEFTHLTVELSNVTIPASHAARFVGPEGRVTVLLSCGATPIPPRIDGALSPIRLIHVQLLTLAELAFVVSDVPNARRLLVDQLVAQHVAPLSRLDRPSVV